jgi:hypothetical protein
MTDVAPQKRVHQLEALAMDHPEVACRVKGSIKRLRHNASKAKYDMFYDVTPLLRFSEQGSPESMPDSELRCKLILSLRIYTLARSSDLANLVPALWVHQQVFYVRLLDKSGKQRLLSMMARTLSLFLEYLHRVHNHPSPFLLRHLKHKDRAMTADAIAGIVLRAMGDGGIPTSLFKAHSLRGASATAMMAHGASQTVTRQRGGWSSCSAFDQHYARLHQAVDWEALLSQAVNRLSPMPFLQSVFSIPSRPPSETIPLGELLEVACSSGSAGVMSPSFPSQEPTTEGERGGDKENITPALTLLTAKGFVRTLGSSVECPVCHGIIQFEASFVCETCKCQVHIRCLQHSPGPQLANRHCFASSKNKCISLPVCRGCGHPPFHSVSPTTPLVACIAGGPSALPVAPPADACMPLRFTFAQR